MGLGNALRRVWAATPGTPPRDSSSTRSRRSRSSRISHAVPAEAPPASPSSSLLTQQQAQERLVIGSYRKRLTNISTRLARHWQAFDERPDEYAPTLEIRKLRSSLQVALESYFAALGAQSDAGIEDVLEVMHMTDERLAQSDAEVAAEVGRFETLAADIASRYASVRSPSSMLNIYADVDAALMELELYRDAWVPVMSPATRCRLDEADVALRKIAQGAAVHQQPRRMAVPPPPDGRQLERHAFSSQINDDYMYRNGSSPQSFDNYEAVLQDRKARSARHNSYETNLSQHPGNPSRRGRSLAGMNGYTDTNGYSRNSPAPQGVQAELSSRYALDSELEDRRDAGSSESGDEGPMLMVISRTRTLRDMAESAMGQRDDHQNGLSMTEHGSNGRVGSTREEVGGRTTSTSRSSRASGTIGKPPSRSPGASKDLEQPNLVVSKNASFASTLYHTRHERVDSISDAGILLQRSNVRGDGRCLFRSLVRGRAVARGNAIPGERTEREDADVLRERTVAELIRYRELLARFFVIEGDFAQYTRKMSHPRTYGGEPELLMLAKLLHVPIAVYIMKNGSYRQIQVYGKQYRGEPLRVLYSDGVHYDALLVVSR